MYFYTVGYPTELTPRFVRKRLNAVSQNLEIRKEQLTWDPPGRHRLENQNMPLWHAPRSMQLIFDLRARPQICYIACLQSFAARFRVKHAASTKLGDFLTRSRLPPTIFPASHVLRREYSDRVPCTELPSAVVSAQQQCAFQRSRASRTHRTRTAAILVAPPGASFPGARPSPRLAQVCYGEQLLRCSPTSLAQVTQLTGGEVRTCNWC